MALIDILMAVYNNEEDIVPQFQSLIEQSDSRFRIIIRDDGSSDHSIPLIESFCQQYPGQVFLIKGEKNLGARDNFGTLMGEAKADYILFCDADDVWLPTKIEESVALMQKNEGIYGRETPLLVHTDLTVVDKHLHVLSPSFWEYSAINPPLAHSLNRLLPQNGVTGCAMLINKPLLKLAQPLPKEAIMHDWWIALVASAFGQIDFLAKPMVLYRQHDRNAIGAKNWKSVSARCRHAKKALHKFERQNMRKGLLKTMHQAAAFLHRYGDRLNPEKKEIVENYAVLHSLNFLKKRYLFFKHRYFKSSFSKNIGMFFLL